MLPSIKVFFKKVLTSRTASAIINTEIKKGLIFMTINECKTSARGIIHCLYESANYESIAHKEYNHKWAEANHVTITSGGFRSVIIPNHSYLPFVIKTGKCPDGMKQCRREVEFYKEAYEAGLGDYFAKYLGSVFIGRREFFLFEKIDELAEDRGYWQDFDTFIDEEYCPCDADELLEFLKDHHIGDCHCQNWGFTSHDDCPVLMDYAGYWDGEQMYYSWRF